MNTNVSNETANCELPRAPCCPTMFASSTCSEFGGCGVGIEVGGVASSDEPDAFGPAAVVRVAEPAAACCIDTRALDIVRPCIVEVLVILKCKKESFV